jgi:hypothetical protein
VIAKVDQHVPTPPPGDPTQDVAWLRLEAEQTFGTGVFGGVTFIQRVLTFGGQVPSSSNSPTISVRYATLYMFYAAAS